MSRLAQMYEAAFRTPPSSQTKADLLTMEELFGLAQDDALSPMLIILLRAADRLEDARRKRSDKEEEFTRTTRDILEELRVASQELEELSAKLGKRRWPRHRSGWEGASSSGVDSYRKHSPLLSYLGCAFQRLRGGFEETEHMVAARWDLGWLLCTITALIMAAIIIGHHLR